jgi:hypothetical protein
MIESHEQKTYWKAGEGKLGDRGEETRGEEIPRPQSSSEMDVDNEGGFTRGGFGFGLGLQACKIETLGNSGGT